MTLIQPAGPTGSARPAQPSVAASGGIRARVWQEGLRAQLEDLLHAVAVGALGPDACVAVARDEWILVESTIHAPVVAATTAALERLAADLEAALPSELPVLNQRLGDHRARAELGYD